MYTIQHSIFGRYGNWNYAESLTEALQIAERVNSEGWLNVRIVHPNGIVSQIYEAGKIPVPTLRHDDNVYLDTWTGIFDDATAKVGTIQGMKIGGETPEEALETAIRRGHPLAWTLHVGVCLHGDKYAARIAAEKRKERRATAHCLTPGQIVIIEGWHYTVAVSPRNVSGPVNSGPIRFVPVN